MSDKAQVVLLIEDNPGDARLMDEMLRDSAGAPFVLERSASLVASTTRLASAGVDLILLDLSLEDSQGWETLERVRRLAPDVPIVVLTGLDDENLAVEAVRAGAQDYLVKGQVDNALLVRAMRYAIERKRAERALRYAVRQWHTTFDAISDGICLTDLSGTIQQCNRAATVIAGKATEEMVGHSFVEIFYRGAQPLAEHLLQRMLQTRRRESAVMQRDASWFLIFVDPQCNEQGEIVGAVHIVVDISKDRRSEQEKAKLEAQLRQAQKMEALGLLAGGVAHDFNNLLTVIQGNAELALSQDGASQTVQRELSMIQHTAQRAASLTQQLLAFGRRRALQSEVVDVNHLVSEFRKMLERVIGEHIALRFDLDAQALAVRADAGALDQVLLNLVINARDAMPQGGTLTISTKRVDLDAAYCADHPDAVAGVYADIAVIDTGVGMDAQTLEHLFEPFFTTKEQGRGTGLGLAVVYGIVKQHNGWIEVASAPGRGTRLDILLPLVAVSESPQAESSVRALPVGHETILLAEDEELLRKLTTSVLESLGYRVVACADGQEVMERFAADPAGFDMLLLDMVMPRLSGIQAYETIVALRPDVPVLFVTGYNSETGVSPFMPRAGRHLLAKPFAVASLARKVREVLDEQHVSS